MLWTKGNVELRIWPLDHCPPHVTAVCRADNWTARFEFSMVSDEVSLWDIKPKQNAPKRSLMNALTTEIRANRMACRETWWQLHQTVCLDNVPVKLLALRKVILAAPGISGDGRIVKGSGVYVAGTGVQVRVKWTDSVTNEVLREL